MSYNFIVTKPWIHYWSYYYKVIVMELAKSPHLACTNPYMTHTYTDSVVSVADSSKDEGVVPPLPPSSPRATQTSSGRAPANAGP